MSENKTRQNIEQDPLNPKDHLNTGYEDGTSDEFTIPPCGIEDADTAIFNLFNEDIGFTTSTISSRNKDLVLKKPLVIFATGERFALAKRLRPPRDKNGTLLLPAISIRRTGFEQTSEDTAGRGINQTTGVLTIKRRLNDSDKDYQNLINKLALKNMQSLPGSGRPQGEDGNSIETQQGGFLEPRLGNNIWEIINIPQPQFFTTTYEVVFWTTYTIHMNKLLEKFVSSYLPQGKMFKLQTDKGYWFMAQVDTSTSDNNFDDFKEAERMIRYTFTMKVKGYILAPQGDTDKVPIRRWVSSPEISFDISTMGEELVNSENITEIEKELTGEKFTLTDTVIDPTTKQTPTTLEKLRSKKVYTNSITGKDGYKYVSILETNEKKGETVYRATDVHTMEEFFKSFK